MAITQMGFFPLTIVSLNYIGEVRKVMRLLKFFPGHEKE